MPRARWLGAPQQPIADPFVSILEILIIVMMPPMVALVGAVHAWAPMEARVNSLLAVVFAGLLAGVTCSVHFVILTVGGHAASSRAARLPLLFSFTWPSVAYALDILARDVFFALSVLVAAPACNGSGLARWIRALLVASGALAVVGPSGIVANDMRLRNIGIVGYVGDFPVASALMALLFYRAMPRES